MTHEIQTPSATYQFTLWPIDTKFNRIAGIYIFLIIPRHPELVSGSHPENHYEADTRHPSPCHPELVEGPQYSLLYIGITNNFRGRFNQHHKIEQAKALGMTHIGILKITSSRKRKKIEREILKHLNPPLNQTWLSESNI